MRQSKMCVACRRSRSLPGSDLCKDCHDAYWEGKHKEVERNADSNTINGWRA